MGVNRSNIFCCNNNVLRIVIGAVVLNFEFVKSYCGLASLLLISFVVRDTGMFEFDMHLQGTFCSVRTVAKLFQTLVKSLDLFSLSSFARCVCLLGTPSFEVL